MDASKDYYAILGLTPSAEEVVIRAAYKALAQRYHPDRTTGKDNHSGARMAEINEAYQVLSNKEKREEYDRVRGSGTQSGEAAFRENDEPTPGPLNDDWNTALAFYPELSEIALRLRTFSWRLAETFRAQLLESKSFDSAENLSRRIEAEFLRLYFGPDESIQQFARELIFSDKRDAAKSLNSAVKVLGERAEPFRIIRTIESKYDLPPMWEWNTAHTIKGIRVSKLAKYKGLSEYDLSDSVREGDVKGFIRDGEIFVEVDDNGELVWDQRSQAEKRGFRFGKWFRSIFSGRQEP